MTEGGRERAGGESRRGELNRPGVFRLNISVGRERFRDLVGHPPAARAAHHGEFDYRALDTVLPHPAYAAQSWVSILNPGESSTDRVRSLLVESHERSASRYRPRS
ncbi:DUF6194 family protein [Rhodococcus kronopolitis]|uniref:DUF6194 family protein n=1 Tax=Rhodococcus kronopolitis TaxID=1460226 RepID=A0ABV9FSD1_9NOCA